MIRKIIREHLHRLPREYYRGQIWGSFTCCIQEQQQIFTNTNDSIVAEFVSILDWARKRNDCVVLLYCFMPEHMHTIIQGQTEHADVYQAMLDFKQKSGFFLRQSPYSWQKGFHDRIIRYEKELLDKLRYVAENPVRRGLVAYWQDYPFTSSLGIPLDVAAGFSPGRQAQKAIDKSKSCKGSPGTSKK